MKESKPVYWEGEDYSKIYNDIDYTGKVVLEMGADVGSTACFYLSQGAKSVISVEGNHAYFEELQNNIGDDVRVIPIEMFIDRAEQIITLIEQYNPDILHMDIESWEFLLLEIPEVILKKIEQFDIEVHWDVQKHNNLIDLFLKNGYWVKDRLYVENSVPLKGIRLYPVLNMGTNAWILKARKSVVNNEPPIKLRRIVNGRIALDTIKERIL